MHSLINVILILAGRVFVQTFCVLLDNSVVNLLKIGCRFSKHLFFIFIIMVENVQ